MRDRLSRSSGPAALVLACIAVLLALTGVGQAARSAIFGASTKPRPFGILKLGADGRFPDQAIPTVRRARRADRLGGLKPTDVQLTCDSATVDLDTWCLSSSLYPVPPEDIGKNNYFYATQACVAMGGYLPTAAQLIGAANRAKLASTIDDNDTNAAIDEDPGDGLRDRREMSATLVTTAAGSSAAGALGVSEGSKGDPRVGEPDPVPQPSVPAPDTLQYVTVYDNRDKGGFAGSKSVKLPENFRCAFAKHQGPPRGES